MKLTDFEFSWPWSRSLCDERCWNKRWRRRLPSFTRKRRSAFVVCTTVRRASWRSSTPSRRVSASAPSPSPPTTDTPSLTPIPCSAKTATRRTTSDCVSYSSVAPPRSSNDFSLAPQLHHLTIFLLSPS